MLEAIKQKTTRLISLYETEKSENKRLREELADRNRTIDTYRKQIEELEQKIDNLKLKGAFVNTSSNGIQAKEKIDRLIKEIDRCIKLLEG